VVRRYAIYTAWYCPWGFLWSDTRWASINIASVMGFRFLLSCQTLVYGVSPLFIHRPAYHNLRQRQFYIVRELCGSRKYWAAIPGFE
jgi:hypothetical protein